MTMQVQPHEETLYKGGPAIAAMSDKIHDVIQTLSQKLDCVWRYEQYAEDCEDNQECAQIFRAMKEDDVKHIGMLRQQIIRLCKEDKFD